MNEMLVGHIGSVKDIESNGLAYLTIYLQHQLCKGVCAR